MISPATSLERAGDLRRLAAALDAALVHHLPGRAGADTWRGPSADQCLAELEAMSRRLRRLADQLRHQARAIEQGRATGAWPR